MRKLISYRLKMEAPDLQAIVARRIYAAGSLGRGKIPADPPKPFIVFRELDHIAANVARDTAPAAGSKVFQFYIHDVKGGYTRIDAIGALVRQHVLDLVGARSPSGAVCMGATWNGTSGDTEDPTYDSNLKILTITLTSSQ